MVKIYWDSYTQKLTEDRSGETGQNKRIGLIPLLNLLLKESDIDLQDTDIGFYELRR